MIARALPFFGFIMLLSGLAPEAIAPARAHVQTQAVAQITMADIETGQGGANASAVVRKTVQSMIEYTRWPDSRRPDTLCVVGPSKFGHSFDNLVLYGGYQLTTRQLRHNVESLAGCDIVYLGTLDFTQMRAVTASVRGAATLTIAENDPSCRSRSMFCLIFGQESLTFRIDTDAVARSAVRIDPRVLRLARDGGGT